MSCAGDPRARSLACDIMRLRSRGQIVLRPNHYDRRGNSPPDGATALDNVRDTCNGLAARRYGQR